jgi:hypothetical protein
MCATSFQEQQRWEGLVGLRAVHCSGQHTSHKMVSN